MSRGLGVMQRQIVEAMRSRRGEANDWLHKPIRYAEIGGDFVHVPGSKRGWGYGYYLADGVHDMRNVARELAPEKNDRSHAAVFSRAVRSLELRGVIEFPKWVALSKDEVGVTKRRSNGLFLIDPPPHRFARLVAWSLQCRPLTSGHSQGGAGRPKGVKNRRAVVVR